MPRKRGWSTKPQGSYVDLRIPEIWRYLDNRGWVMADLARQIGYHRSTVHRLLNGTMACDENKANLIAAAFGVTLEAIADQRPVDKAA